MPAPGQDGRLAWRSTAAAAIVGLAVTAIVLLVPSLRFAYRAPALHVVLETAEAVVALVVAYLVGGRFRQSRRVSELLLVGGLVLLATANLVLSALPAALPSPDQALSSWAPLAVRLIGTLLVAGAALVPTAATVPPGRVRPAVLLGVLAVLVLAWAAVTWESALPPVIDPALDLSDSSRPVLAGHPLVIATQVLSGVLYAVAAVAFTGQAARAPDELLRWLGAGCALGAVARVDYLLFPSLYSDFVYVGDALRLACYLCFLVGAAREVRSYWARAAVLEDRRRLARDLHDGLTQELSYIYAQSQRLRSRPDDPRTAEQIAGAAGRALDEARQAIAALTRPVDESFGTTLEQAVDDLARRYDIRTSAHVERTVVVTPERAEAVLRITAEALRNAVRHGGAEHVSVALTAEPLVLTVADDGTGFDPDQTSSGGFGLTSMRERAEGTGASFVLTSQEREGTRVEVSWS